VNPAARINAGKTANQQIDFMIGPRISDHHNDESTDFNAEITRERRRCIRKELQPGLELARMHKKGQLLEVLRSGMKTMATHQAVV
jgi:hypothetical protein